MSAGIPNIKAEHWYQVLIIVSVIFLVVGLTQTTIFIKNEYVIELSAGGLLIGIATWMEQWKMTRFQDRGFGGLLQVTTPIEKPSVASVLIKIFGALLIFDPILKGLFNFDMLSIIRHFLSIN
jgi:hypothetical protein